MTTNNKRLYIKAKLARSHGLNRENKRYWKNSIESFGMNFRLSDINCALGISQLKKVKKFLSKRKKISIKYDIFLKQYTNYIKSFVGNKSTISSNHLKILHFDLKKFKCGKDMIFKYFKKNRIFLQFHYQPINRYKVFNAKLSNMDGAKKYEQSAVSFPIHYNLEQKDLKKIFKTIINFINYYKKNEKNS